MSSRRNVSAGSSTGVASDPAARAGEPRARRRSGRRETARAPPAPADRRCTPRSSSALRASACARGRLARLGRDRPPSSAGRSTAELARESPTSVLRALGSSAISSLPSSKRTSRTSRFERALDGEVALFGGERDQIRESARPPAPARRRLGPARSAAAAPTLGARRGGGAGMRCGARRAAPAARMRVARAPATRDAAAVPAGRASPPPRPLDQRADHFVRRRQVGRIGDAHQHHFGGGDRPCRRPAPPRGP